MIAVRVSRRVRRIGYGIAFGAGIALAPIAAGAASADTGPVADAPSSSSAAQRVKPVVVPKPAVQPVAAKSVAKAVAANPVAKPVAGKALAARPAASPTPSTVLSAAAMGAPTWAMLSTAATRSASAAAPVRTS